MAKPRKLKELRLTPDEMVYIEAFRPDVVLILEPEFLGYGNDGDLVYDLTYDQIITVMIVLSQLERNGEMN